MPCTVPESPDSTGFTLIELSIVLVIIGLIVGGVLVGRDLIHAAEIRAQISQIEKYNTAVNTFRNKYGYLPGDIPPTTASQFGFFTRTGALGDGDGDAYVSGLPKAGVPGSTYYMLGGETVLFWTDMSAAGVIEGSFNDATDTWVSTNTDSGYAAEMPRATIGNGNFVYVNGYYYASTGNLARGNGFQLIKPAHIGPPSVAGQIGLYPGLTPLDAYNIDQKIDDALPTSGTVVAMYPDKTMPTSSNPGNEILAAFPSSLCVLGPPVTYNIGATGVSTVANCSLRFNASW